MEQNVITLKEEMAYNAQNIQVSTETKAFIILKAKLGDIYGNIRNIAENEFCLTEESNVLKKAERAFSELDDVIMELIQISVRSGIEDSEYKEI
jgi:hypothetical protein